MVRALGLGGWESEQNFIVQREREKKFDLNSSCPRTMTRTTHAIQAARPGETGRERGSRTGAEPTKRGARLLTRQQAAGPEKNPHAARPVKARRLSTSSLARQCCLGMNRARKDSLRSRGRPAQGRSRVGVPRKKKLKGKDRTHSARARTHMSYQAATLRRKGTHLRLPPSPLSKVSCPSRW